MPAISVIVPVYNVELYLNRCIDSILSQTFKDFELILVDDGSTDNSPSICDQYKRDDRIIVLHQENSGVSVARNNGVKISSGDYITFIDSDDWIAPEYLSRLFYACSDYNADISVVSFECVRSEKEAIPKYNNSYTVRTNREAINVFGRICGPNYRSSPAKLVKSRIVRNHPFPVNRIWGEDTACIYQWYWDANCVVEIFGSLYFYFHNASSVSNTKFDRKYFGELDTFEEMLIFYQKNSFIELEEAYVERYFNTAIGYYQKALEIGEKEIANEFLHRIRVMIKKNKKKFGITRKRKTDLYDIAYPKTTRLYRIAKTLLSRMC